MKKLFTLLIVAIATISFAQQTGIALTGANTEGTGGSRSLSGSFVVFDPGQGGEKSYTPGSTQDFVFRTESYTNDFEWVYELWLQFPSDWVVNNVTLIGTPVCTSGATWNAFSFTTPNSYTADISHPRYQAPVDHCVAYYMVNVTVPVTATGIVDVSWYWDGDGWGNPPHHPCSSDQYTPDEMSGEPCDEWVNQPAMIPPYAFECLPGSVFSQVHPTIDNGWWCQQGYELSILADNYTASGPFSSLRIWGGDYWGCSLAATEPFIVYVWDNDPSISGSNIIFSATRTGYTTSTGLITWQGTPLYQIDIGLGTTITQLNGWIGITRVNATCDEAFAWATYGEGNARIYEEGNGWWDLETNTLFCLGEGEGERVPVTNWALFIGIGLILVFAVVRFRKMS
jgi:hypothetical protein